MQGQDIYRAYPVVGVNQPMTWAPAGLSQQSRWISTQEHQYAGTSVRGNAGAVVRAIGWSDPPGISQFRQLWFEPVFGIPGIERASGN